MSDRIPMFYGQVKLDFWDDPAAIVRYLRNSDWNVLRRLADQIEAQIKPPRIPEPGLWGVVKASCVHEDSRGPWVNDGRGWVRIGRQNISPENHDDWSSLVAPMLEREGIES